MDSLRQTGHLLGFLSRSRLMKMKPHFTHSAGCTASLRPVRLSVARICSRCSNTSFSETLILPEISSAESGPSSSSTSSSCRTVSCATAGCRTPVRRLSFFLSMLIEVILGNRLQRIALYPLARLDVGNHKSEGIAFDFVSFLNGQYHTECVFSFLTFNQLFKLILIFICPSRQQVFLLPAAGN